VYHREDECDVFDRLFVKRGVGIGWEALISAQGDERFSHRHSVLSNDGCKRFKKGFRRETV